MHKKFLIAVSLLTSCVLTACGGGSDKNPEAAAPAAPKSDEKITLKVAAFPDLDRAIKNAIPLYEKNHPNVKIELTSLAYPDHHNAMTTALATGSNLPDVMAVEMEYVGKFATSGGLEDLAQAPYSVTPELGKLSKFMLPAVMNEAGSVFALPTDIGPGSLFYRKDMLDKAQVSEADLMQSWESYIEAGKKIKKATGAYMLANAVDIKDIYIKTDLKDGEGVYFNKAGEPLVNSPRFEEAFRLAKMARDAGIDAKINAWSNEWTESFKRDKVATQMMGAWLGGHLEKWLAPEAKGKWRAAQLPNNNFAFWGGSFYSIPKASPQKAAAYEFIKFMTLNKDMQLDSFKNVNAFPALIEAQSDAFMEQPIEYLGGQVARKLWKESADKIQPITVDKFDSVAKEVVNAELDKVLSQGKDIKTALTDAQELLKKRVRR